MTTLQLYLFKKIYESKQPFYYDILFNINFENLFNTNNIENPIIMDIFFKLKKMYHGFSRLVYLYKFKRATVKNTHDLALNPITHNNIRKTIVILQENSLYIITLPELIHIINTSLSYANSFFILEPYRAKNPYTNVPFNDATLYNIYFAVKNSDYKMSPLFHAFFMQHFNLPLFIHTNKYCILEYVIHRHVYKSHPDVLYMDVIQMLAENELTKYLQISPDFPKDILVNILRPYLHIDFRCKYSDVCDEIWTYLHMDLKNMLTSFYMHNPKFGRKFIHVRKTPIKVSFDTFHLPIIKTIHPQLMINML